MSKVVKVWAANVTTSNKHPRLIYERSDGSRNQKTLHCDYKTAQAIAEKLMAEITIGTFKEEDAPAPMRDAVSVARLRDDYRHWRLKQKLSPHTVDADEHFWSAWQNAVSVPNVKSVSSGHVERFKKALNKRGLKPRSINRYLASGSSAWEFAKKKGWATTNPFKESSKMKVPFKDRDIKTYSTGDIRRIVQYFSSESLPPHQKLAVLFALDSGARPDGITTCSIKEAMYDEVDGVERMFITLHEKGQDGVKKTRHVPATDRVIKIIRTMQKQYSDVPAYLRKYIPRHQNRIKIYQKRADAGIIFWMMPEPKAMARFWLRFRNRAGLEKSFGDFYDLRHTFATRLGAIGAREYIIKTLLGHSLAGDVTTAHYLKAQSPELVAAIDAMQNYYGKGKKPRIVKHNFSGV